MKLSLRNRFLIPTLGLIILGMSISSAVSYFKAKEALTEAITGQVTELADSTINVISSWLEDRKRDVNYWSNEKAYQTAVQDSFMGRAARKSADARLADLKKDFKFYEDICIADGKGDVVAASNPEIVNKINTSDRDYFKSAMKGQVVVTDVVQSKQTKNPVFMIAAPLEDGGKVAGVIFGVVDVAYFSKMFIDSVKLGQRGYAFLVNRQGLVVAHPDQSKVLSLNLNSLDWGKDLLSKGEGLMNYTFEGVDKLAALRKNDELGWTLFVSTPTDDVFAPIKALGYVNLAVAGGITLLAAVVILLLVRSIVNPINRVISGLGIASDQVSSGSNQVAASSQQLAEGSSQQAAALEESSASLEEMTSMTKQNASNAGHANTLMKEAIQVISRANDSMQQLTSSMREISHASEETSKIIKTIDEIAFQTNLLALNAAVEAARAGEAGAGFAVVADEVRNLAMRAAEAAKNTAGLIEGTEKKVQEGGQLVARTNDAFSDVAKTSAKVDELVSEIAAASQEQAQGIEQVNKAVAEMDKVTQQSAAIAEESSGASEEMNSQAEKLKHFVAQLIDIVGGNANHSDAQRTASGGSREAFKAETSAPDLSRPVHNRKQLTHRQQNMAPEEVIPMGKDGFEDF